MADHLGTGALLSQSRLFGRWEGTTGLDTGDLWVLATIVLLASGCAVNGGEFSPLGIALVIAACPAAVASIALWGARSGRPTGPLVWSAAVAVLALTNLSLDTASGHLAAAAGLAVVLAIAGVLLCSATTERLRRASLALATLCDLGLVAVRARWAAAYIDVFSHIQGPTQQLLLGHNPYAASYPSTTPGVTTFHYPYLPGLLLLSAPFRLIGDVRLADAAAMVLIIWSVAVLARRYSGPERAGAIAAVAVTMPFLPYMVVQAWPEIFPVAGVALWLLLRDQRVRWGVASLAIGLCVVPTVLPLLVFSWLWWGKARGEVTAAVFLAGLLCVPFALWAGVGHFIADTLLFQLRLPVRLDALSINGLLAHLGLPLMPGWAGIVFSFLVLVLMSRWRERSWDAALMLGSILTLVVFLTAKWAFFNYYFIVACGLVFSLALVRRQGSRLETETLAVQGRRATGALHGGGHHHPRRWVASRGGGDAERAPQQGDSRARPGLTNGAL